MNTLQKLKVIERKKTIYNIHYANAGVGFCFYEGPEDCQFDFRKHLVTYHYYPTFTKAVDAEYKRLTAPAVPNETTKTKGEIKWI